MNAKDAKELTQRHIDNMDDVINKLIHDAVTISAKQCKYQANVYPIGSMLLSDIEKFAISLGYKASRNTNGRMGEKGYVELSWE